MTSDSSRLRRERLVIVAGMIAAGWHALYYWPRTVDDAYIHLRIVDHVLAGIGWRFNPSDPLPVEGFSSPTWTWLCLGLRAAGAADPLLASKAIGLALHVATVAATAILVRRLGSRDTLTTAVAVGLVAASPYAAYHAVAGLEGALVGLLLVTTQIVAIAPGRSWLLGVLLGLVTASRPEGFGYAAVLLAIATIVRRDRQPLRATLVVWALAALLLEAWRWSTFAMLAPNAAIAKALAPGAVESHARGLRYVGRFLLGLPLPTDALMYAGTAAALAAWGSTRDRLTLAVPIAGIAFCVVVNGDWMHSFRFLAWTVPLLAVAVARAIATLGTTWRAARVVALVVVASVGVQLAWLRHATVDRAGYSRSRKPLEWPLLVPARARQGFDAKLPGVTRWALEHLPPGATFATGDVGFPGWVTETNVIDLLGWTDREIARLLPARDASGLAAYLRARETDAILVRRTGGMPAKRYDRLVVASGILDGYAPVARVETYGPSADATIYARGGRLPSLDDATILARYEHAIARSPRVGALRTWARGHRARVDAAQATP